MVYTFSMEPQYYKQVLLYVKNTFFISCNLFLSKQSMVNIGAGIFVFPPINATLGSLIPQVLISHTI